MNYLYSKFKGKYRILCPYDMSTNQFARKLDGTFEDIDCYITCRNNCRIYYYGKSILQAYIPSIIRGHNIIKDIKNINSDLIFDIEEYDSEIFFKFNYKDSDTVIPFLKPKTSGASISPFSTKNLPKNKEFSIPEEELVRYREITKDIPKEDSLKLGKITTNYLSSLTNKKYSSEQQKADMRKAMLTGKDYIFYINKWDDYLTYLEKEVAKL